MAGAARPAYLAAFHVARGMMAGRSGRLPKGHGAMRKRLARLTYEAGEPATDLVRFLWRGYGIMLRADYGRGRPVTRAMAVNAMAEAARFIEGASATPRAPSTPSSAQSA